MAGEAQSKLCDCSWASRAGRCWAVFGAACAVFVLASGERVGFAAESVSAMPNRDKR